MVMYTTDWTKVAESNTTERMRRSEMLLEARISNKFLEEAISNNPLNLAFKLRVSSRIDGGAM